MKGEAQQASQSQVSEVFYELSETYSLVIA